MLIHIILKPYFHTEDNAARQYVGEADRLKVRVGYTLLEQKEKPASRKETSSFLSAAAGKPQLPGDARAWFMALSFLVVVPAARDGG